MSRHLHHTITAAGSMLLLVLGLASGCASAVPTAGPSIAPSVGGDFSPSIDMSSPNETAAYQRPVQRPHRAQIGESCAHRRCVDGATCVGYGEAALCSQGCDPDETFCADGALCLPLGDGTGVCSSWGSGSEGDSCSTATDCGVAQSCVSIRGAAPTCIHICDFGGGTACCPEGRECQIASGSMDYGVCSN